MKRNIPSAGPWITDLEVEYVTDACKNGWYSNWSGYLDRFESSFAEYLGVSKALATSSCTGALHISMKALDIGPGDEVIVPESTWIATATCVSYVGATPVFADIEEDTWCICPEDVKRKITTNTKAVIAVHNYGHPADMLALKEICEQANIYLVEDAAPGIGSRIDDTLVGTFGDISCFSFQGAKPIVTGEGGMLTTDNPELFERAYYYWDHCRDTSKVLYNTDVGLKYKMSNIQAALGLAQLERIDEIIGKRRQIFAWYEERLGDLEGINMNVERPGIYSNFYVPTIVLNEKSNQSPDKVMQFLNDNGVMNRPFFRCISKMMPQYNEAVTPIADKIVPRGINLPCASILSEDDVDYSAKIIREALCQ